ncbi:MAG TPA: hypothetical protein VHZ26_15035 [Caulobacteraceae bacterium]|jgi:hypothetical protein|nr:hypothetical protein [Caulobacteraceae bacterium]
MSSTTKTNQASTLSQTQMPVTPSWVAQPLQGLTSQITALGAVPASSYVAPQSALQQQANAAAASTLTGTNPNYAAAANDISGNAALTPGAISSYLSPYLSNVLNTTNAALSQTAGQQDANLEAQGAANGAFGGSRFGVAQGILGGQQQLAQGQADANILNSGYNSAVSAALNNAQLGQSAGQNLTQLGNSQNASNIANVAELANLGGAQQATAQAQATAPIALAQAMASLYGQNQFGLFNGQTVNGLDTSDQTSTSTNPMGILSGLLQAGAAAATGGASLIGSFAPAVTGNPGGSLNMAFANS